MIGTAMQVSLTRSAVTLALLLSASQSISQTDAELGSRISRAAPAEIPQHHLSAPDKARAAIFAFSMCVVLRSRVAVERALALPATDAAAAKALRNLAMPECLASGEIGMTTSLLRGGLFNALYRKDFSRKALPLYDKPLDYRADVSDPASPASQSYVALHDFADCVVRSDPVDARATVLSTIATPDEAAAYARLGPSLNGCMTVGQNLAFSKLVLSGLLSETLYRQSTRE